MKKLFSFVPTGDRWLLLAYLALCLTSLAILWSVTEGLRGPYEDFDSDLPKAIFVRQMVWILVGWVVLCLAARIPLRHLESLAWPIYAVTVVLLLCLLLFAPEVAGARRWFVLGPLRLQPSEVAKISFIVVAASLLSSERAKRRTLLPVAVSLLLVSSLFLLVLRQPDLGTALVFPALWLGMVFWLGVSGLFLMLITTPILSAVISFYTESVAVQAWPWAVYLLLLIVVLYVARFRLLQSGLVIVANLATGIGMRSIWFKLATYQQVRVMSFFKPSQSDEFGPAYQAIQSKIAIGSGGLLGTHYLQGTQKGLAFLPERHTDFIFSVIGEELGFVGALLVLGLFLIIILRGLRLAVTAERPFPSFLAAGAVFIVTFHVVVNVAIATGLLPVTGLPLPLISYGGSNLLASSFLVGLLINIGTRQYET